MTDRRILTGCCPPRSTMNTSEESAQVSLVTGQTLLFNYGVIALLGEHFFTKVHDGGFYSVYLFRQNRPQTNIQSVDVEDESLKIWCDEGGGLAKSTDVFLTI
ncbi:UNVERIFIED_CONTAM: hypothetical protein FKN15_046797 [Acipenser sinensis]